MSSSLANLKKICEEHKDELKSKEVQMYIWSLLTEKSKEVGSTAWLAAREYASSDDESDEEEPEVEEIFINDTKKIWYAMTADPKWGRSGTIFDPETGEEHPEGITLKDLVHYTTEEHRDEEPLREIKLYIINTSK